MSFYQRRLPHTYATEQPVFLTWRVHGSLPSNRPFPVATLNSGQAFVAMDRLLDEGRAGPFYLRQPALADMIVEAIEYNAAELGHYHLWAFVVMPNHVHLSVTPVAPAEDNQVVKGHYGQAGESHAGIDGTFVLARGELRSPGPA